MVYQKFYLNVKIKLILFFPDIPAPEYVLSYCVKKKKTQLSYLLIMRNYLYKAED